MKNSDSQYNVLNIFRALLALGIVWHHMSPPVLIADMPVNVPGRVIVWLFFLLSGYVISCAFYEGRYVLTWLSIRKFYWRRLIRVVPLLYAVYFVIWFMFDRGASILNWSTFKELLFIQYSFEYKYVEVAWFLGPLVQLYVIFPAIFWSIQKYRLDEKPLKMFLGVIVLSILFKYISLFVSVAFKAPEAEGIFPFLDDRTMLGSLSAFLFGTVIYPLRNISKEFMAKERYSGACLLAGVGITAACSILYVLARKYFWILPTSTLAGIGGVCLIIWCNDKTRRFQEMPGNTISLRYKLMAGLGVFSYGIFLWHNIWIEKAVGLFPGYQDNYGYFVLVYAGVIALTVLTSALTYYLVEMPFSRLRKVF